MNKVVLIGRLIKEPDFKQTEKSAVARYTLAVERKYSKNEEKEADFINCVTFGKNAEFVKKYLKKGPKIAASGRIQTGSYTNNEGSKIFTTDVVVEEHEFCEKANSAPTSNDFNDESITPVEDDDNPFC